MRKLRLSLKRLDILKNSPCRQRMFKRKVKEDNLCVKKVAIDQKDDKTKSYRNQVLSKEKGKMQILIHHLPF